MTETTGKQKPIIILPDTKFVEMQSGNFYKSEWDEASNKYVVSRYTIWGGTEDQLWGFKPILQPKEVKHGTDTR